MRDVSLTEKWMAPAFYAILACGLSLWILQFQYFIGYDGVFYARTAENLFAGKGFSVNGDQPYTGHGLFYSFLLGFINLMIRDVELSGHLLSACAFGLTAVPLCFLARRIYPEATVHWIGWLYATNGFLLIHSNMVIMESVFTLFIVTGLYLILRMFSSGSHPLGLSVAFGLMMGLAYLTRPEGLLFYGMGVLSILAFCPTSFRQRLRVVSFSLLVFLPLFLSHVWMRAPHSQKLELSSVATQNLILRQMDVSHPGQYLEMKKIYEGLTADKREFKLEELKKDFNVIRCLTKDNFAIPRSVVPSFVWRLMELNKYLFAGLGFFFMGASFFGTPWDERRKRSEGTLLLYLATFFPQLIGIFLPKRFFHYFPILLLWVANGLDTFMRWIKDTFNCTKRASFNTACMVCLFFLFFSTAYLFRTLRDISMPMENKELGLWMKQYIPRIEEKYVAAQHPSVNFYSGSKIFPAPHIPYVDHFDDFLTFMAHHDAKFFVVSDDMEIPVLDSYRFLLDESKPPPAGILRKHIVRGTRKVILYELLESKEP